MSNMKHRSIGGKSSPIDGDLQDEELKAAGCGDNRCLSEQPWALLVAVDCRLTSKLAVCTDASAALGNLRGVMKFLEMSCHGIPWLVCNVLALFYFKEEGTRQILVNLLMALILDLIIVAVIKMIVRRPRPAHNKMDMFATVSVDMYSFPSGHTTRAAMVACFLIARLYLRGYEKLLVVVWAISVALSRVLLGRHHVGDVVCGLAIGVLQYRLVKYLWLSRTTCVHLLDAVQL